jgi:hypothetical protein
MVSAMSLRGAALVILVASGLVAPALAAPPGELADKNDGGYITGLPLFAYTTDLGLGLGARVYYYWNGHPDDPRFAQTPYLYRIFLQGFASTRGLQFHWLDLDAPKIAGSAFRVRGQLIFQRNINSNYFGVGERALPPLAFPGGDRTYDSYDDYVRDQARITDGQTFSKYDQYDLLRPILVVGLERLFANDRVRVLGGVGLSYARIRDYTGRQVDATDAAGNAVKAPQAETRLAADCRAGRIVGCDGGRDDFLRLGISYDTRDYEPDPNRGVFVDLGLDLGSVALGSEYDYVRVLVAARGYWSPLASADVVLAGRLVFEAQTNGVPFFSMSALPFTDDPRAGLGGHRTLRGFRQDRFVGSVMTLANAELRWTWGHARILGQRFAFLIAPFFDVGRPYDALDDLTLRAWQAAYGAAFRVAWNQATIVTVDYGRSAEDAGLYVNFNHIF